MILIIIPIIIIFIPKILYHIIHNILFELLPQNDHKKYKTNYSEPVRIFATNTNSNGNNEQKHKIDFCFFINGFLGNSIRRNYQYESIAEALSNNKSKHNNNIILHFISSNNGKTYDGVKNGGIRVANEIWNVIHDELEMGEENDSRHEHKSIRNKYDITDITISIFGHSLGGIYGRYAAFELYEMLANTKLPNKKQEIIQMREMTLNNGKIKVHFNTFCSLLSPHMGEAKHSFFSVTRQVELFIGRSFKQSGHDIYHLNDLLWEMATSPKFLKPLGLFHKRVAYSNTFHTDLMVSTSNGSFLHSYSQYPHEIINHVEELMSIWKGFVVATVLTKKTIFPMKNKCFENQKENFDMLPMSICLDSLGWTKIFLDTRSVSPSTIHFTWRKRKPNDIVQEIYNNLTSYSCKTNGKYIIESRMLQKVLAWQQKSMYSFFPFGHLISGSLSAKFIASSITYGGRPLSHFIAKKFAEDISSFHSNREE